MAEIADDDLIAGFRNGERYRYPCPVCGLDWRWTEPRQLVSESFNICPQCGVEFGYQDSGYSHEHLRREWINAALPQKSESEVAYESTE